MTRKHKTALPFKGAGTSLLGSETEVLDTTVESKSSQCSNSNDVSLEMQTSGEASDLESKISLKPDALLSSEQGDGATSAHMESQKKKKKKKHKKGRDTDGMGLFLYVHFFLWPIARSASGPPSTGTLTPRLQKIAQSIEGLFPAGTRFEVRREVRLNRHVNQRDHMKMANFHVKRDLPKCKITLCEEHRFMPANYADVLSPCDELPFHMAFIFDPTLVAEVTHYTNLRHISKKGKYVVPDTYFVAVFRGVEIFSIRELVEAFFRAYLEKTEEEIEKNHPFQRISPAERCAIHELSNSSAAKAAATEQDKPAEMSDTIPVELVSPRAFLEAKEHYKLIRFPVQQVLVRDRELGVMVLGRAMDKHVIGPPARPSTASKQVSDSKSSDQSGTHSTQTRSENELIRVPSPLLPPFALWHLTGATVEVVGLFTRPSSSIPEFRVRCSRHDNDDVTLSQWSQKSKKKRTREGQAPLIMSLEDAHHFLSGLQEKEMPKRGMKWRVASSVSSSGTNTLTSFNEALDAFRLYNEMGPTLGWLLRSSTAFLIV
ncbi:hypothetical protein TraAM80_09386 [Trypanosoma rangeli]|uniref:Uncharacterized protein n=1 Tax=Trypanosoma rangeli TaxID=5698 RepID=A0A3R7MYT2_TRYRA|nr:uncharacterized protein TraAM80_09386 [Trypanosoma rangeli]RNE97331.1 hypothetical protein TraAM80_09386 [Trypanosoma rangeli]|eukprot:RNE97331.1 hypothetical protein TraAM80_09386 [Trypanosoma rangeli]